MKKRILTKDDYFDIAYYAEAGEYRFELYNEDDDLVAVLTLYADWEVKHEYEDGDYYNPPYGSTEIECTLELKGVTAPDGTPLHIDIVGFDKELAEAELYSRIEADIDSYDYSCDEYDDDRYKRDKEDALLRELN